jgi:hypothetical protein
MTNLDIISITPLNYITNIPQIIYKDSTPILRQLYLDSIYLSNPIYPIKTYIKYPDLNSDPDIQIKIIKNIWKKLKYKWIYEFIKIFRFIKRYDDTYTLVDSIYESKNNKDISSNIEKKASWFLKNIFTISDLAKVLTKYKHHINVDYWNIDKDKERLKRYIYHNIKHKILNNY